jgi:hypothetical protein
MIDEFWTIDNSLFNKYGKPLYMDDNYFLNKRYDHYNIVNKGKRRPSKCMYPGCHRKTIIHSHVLPKSTVLKNISKENMLIFPKYNSIEGLYEFQSIDISNASVFPGFCAEHENIFDFEKSKNLQGNSIFTQNFRIICRDLFSIKNQLNAVEKQYHKYKNELFSYNKKAFDNMITRYPNKNFRFIDSNDEITKSMEVEILRIKELIDELENDFYIPYYHLKIPRNYVSRSLKKI